MRVLVAGASGAIGRILVPMLVDAEHEVIAMSRSTDACGQLERLGARAFQCDVFAESRLARIFAKSKPEAVINQLTSIPADMHPRRVVDDMAATNRLRTEGTAILMRVAGEAGARRVLGQSIAFAYAPTGDAPATESERLYLDAPSAFSPLISAVHACEQATLQTEGVTGVVLRYGYFYGPGTIYTRDGSFGRAVAKRGVPLVGHGTGVFSFIHVADAAAATVRALDSDATGIFNIVDDDPAPVREWLPHYAASLGAPKPIRVPGFVGRLAGGPYLDHMMLAQRGASNTRARQVLGWQPRFTSWREGFVSELALPADAGDGRGAAGSEPG